MTVAARLSACASGAANAPAANGARGAAGGTAEKLAYAASMLTFESKVRTLNDERELFASLCNETRAFLPFRQAFLLKRGTVRDDMEIIAASSLAVIDRDAPFVRWLEKIAKRMGEDAGADRQQFFSLPAYCDDADEERLTYPFPEFLWTPLKDGDAVIGGFIATRETVWQEADAAAADRLAALYAHAWRSIKGRGRIAGRRLVTPPRAIAGALLAAAISLCPISITSLAPMEIAPKDAFVVAAPFDGVVEDILVDQGKEIAAGTPVIAFEDVLYKNDFEIADRNEAVAKARLLRASQGAIGDPEAKRDLAVASAEHALAEAERAYAKDLLDQTVIAAPHGGVAIYTDKRDWAGRPVAAGEAILQIADPGETRISIDLPVKESLEIDAGARVKVFLDSSPLRPFEATLVEIGYSARADKRDVLSYRLYAELSDRTAAPRIGVQGTAQVFGGRAPLIYVVLRRPLAALRQLTGW